MATAQQFIDHTLILMGALDPGASPSASESDHALISLNRVIGSWSAAGVPVPSLTRQTKSLTGASSYSFTGTDRPLKIRSASVIVSAPISRNVPVVSAAEWASVLDKGSTQPFAEAAYYEDGLPTGKLHLAPKPTTGGTIQIHSKKSMRDAFVEVRESFALTGAAYYTIGVGGTFVTERPISLLGIEITATTTASKPLRIVSAEEYAAFVDRGASPAFGDILFCDNAYPDCTVYIAPKAASGTLELFTLKPLSTISALGDTINLPPGYEQALQFALAQALAPSYRSVLTPEVTAGAMEAKQNIAKMNAEVLGTGAPSAPPPPAQ